MIEPNVPITMISPCWTVLLSNISDMADPQHPLVLTVHKHPDLNHKATLRVVFSNRDVYIKSVCVSTDKTGRRVEPGPPEHKDGVFQFDISDWLVDGENRVEVWPSGLWFFTASVIATVSYKPAEGV